MVVGVNHIGMAVNGIDKTLEQWAKNFGAVVLKEKRAFPGGQTSCLIEIQGQQFELMEPNGEGKIKKFLENHGEGLHHISLKVSNVDEGLFREDENGMHLLGAKCRKCGEIPFVRFKGRSPIRMGVEAAQLCIQDAGIDPREIQVCYGSRSRDDT